MTTYAPAASYRANAVLTASSPQLIVMLYDGARRFLHRAGVAMAARDIPEAHKQLVAAEQILRHLRNTLDMDQGEIPANLASIYTFSLRHIQRARFAQDPKMLEQVSAMLGQLRSSWATIAEQESSGSRPAGQPAPVAVLAG